MSEFDTRYQAQAARSLAAVFGLSVTYTPDGGEGSTITAVSWSEGETVVGYYPDSEQELRVGVLVVTPADVSSPDIDDTVTIGGEVWAVKAIGARLPLLELQLERRIWRGVGRGHRKER